VHAEWTKLRTTPGTPWLLVGLVLTTVAVSAAAAASVTCAAGVCSQDATRLSLTGVDLGQAVVAVLAVLAVSSEYSSGLVSVSFTATPRRLTVLGAKAVVVAGAAAAAGSVAVLGSLVAGRLVLPAGAPLSFADGTTWRAGVGSVLYLVLIGLLSLGVGVVVRDGAVAIGVVLGALYLSPILAHLITDPVWHRRVQQWGPMEAGLNIRATVDLDALPLTPWSGLGVVAVWASVALVVGGLLLHRRDV